MNKTLTLNDQIYIGLKNQHDRFSEVYNIHRLIIITHLSFGKTSFKTLKEFCATSDGNYPKTSYILTKKGLTLFEELQSYIIQLFSTKRLHLTSTMDCDG